MSKQIDISYKSELHQGMNCVSWVKYYKKKYHQLKPLTLVLKQFIKNASLNDTYYGGINSYGLILMVVSFLQLYISNQKEHMDNYAFLLIEFIKFYNNLEFTSYFICPFYKDFNNPFIKKVYETQNIEWIDPLQSNNNVLKSCYKYDLIDALLRIGLFKLFETDDKILKNFFQSAKIFIKLNNN